MGRTIDRVKALTRGTGLFFPARRLYRRFSPLVRERERNDRALFGAFVRPGTLVFDIGANLGQKTGIFLDLGARVVSVEPNPLCQRELQRRLARDPRVSLVAAAVGAESGTATLHFTGTDATGSLRGDWFAQTGKPSTATEVAVTTLEELIARFGIPDYCKIDVEGFEAEVMRGLHRPLPLMSLEFHLSECARLQEVVALREALGPAEFNCIALHGRDMALDGWVDGDTFRRRMDDGTLPEAGDVFARTAAA